MTAFVPSLVQTEAEPAPTIRIRPWADPVLDTLGQDPRHAYFETFWVGVVGPSQAWLLRRLVTMLNAGIDSIDADDLAGLRGNHRTLVRAIDRLCHFGLCRRDPDGTIAVRRRVPPLTLHQVSRLSPTLRGAHDAWQARQLGERANGAERSAPPKASPHSFATSRGECPWCGEPDCERHCVECGRARYDRRRHTDAGTVV